MIHSQRFDRLALVYSDGSFGVLSEGTTIETAREEREFCDRNEHDPQHLTKIARVQVTILDVLEGDGQ
ncbi:MAG: hypothetical protein ACR652_00630 [Methylocystis sp.]|uniref:hypothetical protein n=1 Tax=Methylocystis sp. TaxID=1911079 RepID=UPI003DA362B1